MEARGRDGCVRFDGRFVTITPEGLLGRMRRRTSASLQAPIGYVVAVQWRPAGYWNPGFIHIIGAQDRAFGGWSFHHLRKAAASPKAVCFDRWQQPRFEELRSVLEHAIAQRPGA
ncbi:hypothetical protein RM780_21610 [Streptomyces sp. DSM 44917]|uniref:DUF4429 domain-containing protein n=1 Tax=Streptomyces boetiae TaxID=3075541 RepID=A0ABU2LD74_9ACTN|nr:DUF4429 domain-containing protein [Streptomyces sp. DSM 44917]MDT0309534.1 hypothetical protein [Streptomyces sp. DSM 44917]